ncbi:MAG TPA: nuclear transport factor 2 family protein [Cellulomonas sp.]
MTALAEEVLTRDLDTLREREGVLAALRRYAQGVDQRDVALYRSAFTPGARVEVPGWLDVPTDAEGFWAVLAGEFDTARLSGQHLLANTLVRPLPPGTLRGVRRVRAVTSFLATTTERAAVGPGAVEASTPAAGLAVDQQSAAGLYVDDLELGPAGWQIAVHVVLRVSDDVARLAYSADQQRATAGAAHDPAVAVHVPHPAAAGSAPARTRGAQMTDDLADEVRDLVDRAQIRDVLHAYAQAQDQDRWDLFDRVFTPDAEIDLPGTALGTLAAADLGRFLREDFNATRVSGQHLIANTLVDLDGDAGTARSTSEVAHLTLQRTDRPGVLHRSRGTGLYTDTWQRTADGWRIAHRVATQKHLEEDDVTYPTDLLTTIEAGARTDWFEADLDGGPSTAGPSTTGGVR